MTSRKPLAALLALAVTLTSGLASAHGQHELYTYRAMSLCDEAAQGWLEDDQLPEADLETMWEACVRLVTPVTVLPAAQHYDTTSGAFWE